MANSNGVLLQIFPIQFSDLHDSNLFSETECLAEFNEIQSVLIKAIRISRSLSDFKQLLNYLMEYLQKIRAYSMRIGIDVNKTVCIGLKFKLMNNIIFCFEKCFDSFLDIEDLYLPYLNFIVHNPFDHWTMARRVKAIMEVFHTEPQAFQYAGAWFFKQNEPRVAIDILLQGLTHHRTDLHLYLDLIELELLCQDGTNEVQRLKEYMDMIDININQTHVFVHMLKLLFKHPRLYAVSLYVMNKLLDRYQTDPVAWNAVALMELKGCYRKNPEEVLPLQSPKRSLLRSIACFRLGLKTVSDTNTLWKLYLVTLDEHYNKPENANDKGIFEKTITDLFEEAYSSNVVLEEHHWTSRLTYCKEDSEMEIILNKATKQCPKSPDFWKLLLTLNVKKKLYDKATAIFKQAIGQLGALAGPVWRAYENCNLIHNFTHMKLIYQQGAQQPHAEIAIHSKENHMKYVAAREPIANVRVLYEQYTKAPPHLQSKEVYETMLKMERLEEKQKINNMSKIYQRYVKYFGANNMQLWQDWANLAKPLDAKMGNLREERRRNKIHCVLMRDFKHIANEIPEHIKEQASGIFYKTLNDNVSLLR